MIVIIRYVMTLHKLLILTRFGEFETCDVFGTPGRIRTCDLRIRSPLLYPAELQAHTWDICLILPFPDGEAKPEKGDYYSQREINWQLI